MLLKELTEVYERVRGTSSKLEKILVVAELLQKTPSETLPLVCYLLRGRVFPEYSAQELHLGWSSIWDAIRAVTTVTNEDLTAAYNQFGDLGSAAELIFGERPMSSVELVTEPLTVEECYAALVKIATLSGKDSGRRKKAILKGLLNQSSPPEAKFIVKTITGEMRYGFKEGLLEEAIAHAFSVDLELLRKAYMLRSDIGEVARIAKEQPETLSTLSIVPGRPLRPMLAETAENLEEGFKRFDKALFEFKYDGARLSIHKNSGKVHIFTREAAEVSASLPEVVADIKKVPHSFIADCEIIPFEHSPKAFQELIKRLRRRHRVEEFARKIPVKLYVFDLLYLDGTSLIDTPLIERRKLLSTVIQPTERIERAKCIMTKSSARARIMFQEALDLGFEGLMIKNPHSHYTPGKRGIEWLKLKPEAETLDLVVVAVEYGHGKRAHLLSDYTFAIKDQDGALAPIAKAYCGLKDREIEEMTRYFKGIAREEHGRTLVVEPTVVVEVKFGEIQRSSLYE
ncbi:MAG: ATP-dependent DNA ligase, partial [Methanophagales archaeon ANME-1-THS]